jgi:cold shock CspA family protein
MRIVRSDGSSRDIAGNNGGGLFRKPEVPFKGTVKLYDRDTDSGVITPDDLPHDVWFSGNYSEFSAGDRVEFDMYLERPQSEHEYMVIGRMQKIDGEGMPITGTPDHFITVLAERLAAIVPDGFYVTAEDGGLRYSGDEGRFPGQQNTYDIGQVRVDLPSYFGVHATEEEKEQTIYFAERVLDELQDYVSEATHMPWPGTTRQPSPHSRIAGGQLYLWYGNDDNDYAIAVLACEPIALH